VRGDSSGNLDIAVSSLTAVGKDFSAPGKILTAKLEAGKLPEESRREIGEGELPAAVIRDGEIHTGFVRKNAERRGIWFALSKK